MPIIITLSSMNAVALYLICISPLHSVSGVASHKTLKITMCNLNKQSKLYSQGMTPVYRTVPGKIKWERVRERPTYEVGCENFTSTAKEFLENGLLKSV